MADDAADMKKFDAKAALAGYVYPQAGEDQKAIDTVENAIHSRFPDGFEQGVAEGISAKNAGVDEEEAKEQERKAQEAAAKERLEHPDEVKKEQQTSPPGELKQGAPVKPSIKQPHVAQAKATEPKHGGKGGGEVAKPKAAGKHAAPQESKVPAPPTPIVLAGAEKTDFDAYLNGYPSKSPETTEKLSKIREMSNVAKGFDKQVESVIPKDGEHGTWFKNQLGKNELAAFTENPYEKVQGGLGKLMRFLSKTNAVVSMVGNITGKLGLILTIVGFFAMIFPPLGAAIEAVARVLNIIGLVCDGLGLLISGALTGLNGVVLARQIGNPGCTNEEKAATADLMVSEATSAGGHVMNLAMHYGPKFMKGFKGASKGVVGQLFNKVKSSIAKFGAKTLGPVGNWAKNIVFKTGIGVGEKSALMTKVAKGAKAVWKAPETALDYVRDTKAIKWVNNTRAMKAAGRFGAGVNRTVENSKILRGIEGTATESLGEKLSNVGQGIKSEKGVTAGVMQNARTADGTLARRLEISAAADREEATRAIETNAAKNAGNKEAGRIDKAIRSKRQSAMDKGWEGDLEGSKPDWQAADKLEGRKAHDVHAAEEKGLEAAKAEKAQKAVDEQAATAKATKEEAETKQFVNDPKKSQEETKEFLDENDKKQAVLKKEQAEVKAELKKKNIPADEKKHLEEKLAKIKHERTELRHESSESQLVGVKAAGGESPENLWQAKEKWGAFSAAAFEGKDEKAEKQKEAAEEVGKASGHEMHEEFEKEERHEAIEKLGEVEQKEGEGWVTPDLTPSGAAAYVNTTLDGLDADTGFEDHEDDQDAADGAQGADEDKAQPDAAPDETAHVVAPPQPAAAQPATDEGAKDDKGETGGELPELAYWPNLVKKDGDFDSAAQQLYRMKQIAYAFQKQQVEAKKKAIEQWQTMMSADEYAAAKQKFAAEHHKSLEPGVAEQKGSANAANASAGQLGTAAAKQDESKSHAGGEAQKAPDPGAKPGLLHPIKRIWWYVKSWASKAAAKVFGFIQEKIGSIIMKMLCGVSMADMKKYTLALHRRSEWSALTAGGKGIEAAKQAMAKSGENSGKAKSAAEEALADAQECDQNMTDAGTFMKNIEASEKDLAEEQQRAAQFIASLKAAVAAERQRKQEQQAKERAENEKKTFGGILAPKPAMSTPKPQMSVAPKKKAASEKKKKPVSAASVSKVQSAAQYVSKQATIVTQQLMTSKQSQSNQLEEKLEKVGKKGIDTKKLGTRIVDEMSSTAKEIMTAATSAAQQTPADNSALQSTAGEIRSQAKHLDEASTQAFQSLNEVFKSTYEAATHAA